MEALEPFGKLMQLGGTFGQALGVLQQGEAAKEAEKYTARRFEQAGRVASQQAGQREDAIRRAGRQVLGKQRAAFAQSGGGMGGSAADVMRQSGTNAELDALIARYEGDLQRGGYISEGRARRFAGQQAWKASKTKAVSTLLGGAADYTG